MKNALFIPLVFLLTGCPGGGKPSPEQRGVFMHNDVICFSIDKKDTLDFYNIYYEPHRKYTVVKATSNVKLSYPDTCITVKLKHGYFYYIYYGLNGKYYSDEFFINNDGNR
ncbi:putative T6SS immunity periplasmic lipoprotein [Lelliottia amnigena]|uniref:putative T6SS immunity periplasmic lipoprotein n=1 Tax=Lelliottia amnigena TaxID=61646 RepID=UPI003BA110A1